ncbi:MAG: hypothetical protein KKA07_09180 [Bacteroidetes bacterium]|nr:hypothetical protein [Bacteroidota bacterium]
MKNDSFVITLFQDWRTVFELNEVAMLLHETNFANLKQKLHYYVHIGVLGNPRRGIYVKKNYNPEEIACKLFKPSYLSLEYVLQQSGIIFQYTNHLTMVSYLSRRLEISGHHLLFRKIKNEILLNTEGIIRDRVGVNIASPERAFLDTLYLNKEFYADNVSSLNKEFISKLLPLYNSTALRRRVEKHFDND